MKIQFLLSGIQHVHWNRIRLALFLFLILTGTLFGCQSAHFKPMTLGFDECDLIFSVHDRCYGIPEELQLTLNFEIDHGGVTLGKDNVTLIQDDFSLKDVRGCLHSPEIRIPYRIETSGAQDFKWLILKEGEAWAEYKVIIRECSKNPASETVPGSTETDRGETSSEAGADDENLSGELKESQD